MKLNGIRVLDLSRFLPGPHLAMMMSDHGADVIKVEDIIYGDPTRNIGPKEGGVSAVSYTHLTLPPIYSV